MGLVTTLSWFVQLLHVGKEHRRRARVESLEAIESFIGEGETSEEREALVKSLKKDYEFIGFAPNIFYMKETGTKSDMSVQWVHPFSSPTLLYKHKKAPVIIITNAYLALNKSSLRKIDANTSLPELQEILGITG